MGVCKHCDDLGDCPHDGDLSACESAKQGAAEYRKEAEQDALADAGMHMVPDIDLGGEPT